MYLILFIILILLLLGSVPAYPWNAGWGYYPMSGVGLVLLVVLLVFLSGRR